MSKTASLARSLEAARRARGRKAAQDDERESPPPAGARTKKGQKRYQELIAGTIRALNIYGYSRLSVKDITGEAKAPTGLFYRYFQNKNEAVLAAIEQIVESYRAAFSPAGEVSFYEHQLAAHRVIIRFYATWPGVISCYYSFDLGEPVFSEYFQKQTRTFDETHARWALADIGADIDLHEVLPLAHGMTCMTDNFLFRLFTNRDETSVLVRSSGVDLAVLLAGLRTRCFLTQATPSPGDGLQFPAPAEARAAFCAAPSASQEIAGPMGDRAIRAPKRIDSNSTLERILHSVQGLLNDHPYDTLRIKDLEEHSGTTRGGLYHYFDEKRDIALEVIRRRLAAARAELRGFSAKATKNLSAYEVLDALALILAREYSANPGVLRAIYDLEDRDVEVARLVREWRHQWAQDVALWLQPEGGASRRQIDLLMLIAFCMLSLIDRYAFDLFVLKSKSAPSRFETPEDFAHFVAALWHRMLFRANPSAAGARLPRALKKLAAA
ncbi:MAG: TetR/AcrR family transcriptional regulator [Pseudomonadota bacterium]